ncbi:MAG: hypothetical protein V1917_01595 [Candidatus Gottesmanbacteria bacterium]
MKKAVLILILLTCFITYLIFLPYSNKLHTNLPNAVDPVFYAWNINHNTQSVLQKGRGMLDTNIFYPEGNTLSFSDTLYGQTIFTMPIQLLTNNVVLTENLYIFITFPLAAISMFFLSYFLTKHLLASFLSGIFFAFAYPRLAQIGHMPMISSQWIPLFVLYLIKYMEHGSWKHLLLTFLFYLLSIASSIYFGIFLIPFVIFTIVLESIRLIKEKSIKTLKRILRSLAIFFIPMMGVLILVLYPYIRLKIEYPQIKRSLEDSARFSAQLVDYKTVLPTSWLATYNMFPTNINERPLYLTATLTILAIFGMIVGWKKYKKYVALLSLTGISAWILSFGPYLDIIIGKFEWFHVTMPYYYLYQFIPLMQTIRVPSRFSIIVVLAFSALAAIGLSHILKRRFKFLLAGLIILLFMIEVWQIQTPSVPIPLQKDIPVVYQWLSKQSDSSIIVEIPFRPFSSIITSMEDQLFQQYSEIKENEVYALEAYRTYFSSYHRKRMLNGYSGFFPQIYHDQAMTLQHFPSKESISMLEKQHVRYVIVHAWQYTDTYMIDVKREASKFQHIQLVQQFGEDYVYEIIKK